MIFELEENGDGVDYASFLAMDVMDYEEREVAGSRLSFKAIADSISGDLSKIDLSRPEQQPSKFRDSSGKNYTEIWEPVLIFSPPQERS
jgi:hypothetical protein